MRKKYDVIIRGAYGTRNFGDDMLLLILFNYLTARGFKNIALISKESPYLRSLLGRQDLTVFDPTGELHADVSFFIWGGGTQFYSFDGYYALLKKVAAVLRSPFGYIRSKRAKKGGPHVQLNAENTLLVGVGIGPYKTLRAATWARKKVEQADKVFVRDQLSLSYLKQWLSKDDFKNKASLFSDLLFLDQNFFDGCLAPKFCEGANFAKKKKKKVAVIVRDWNYSRAGSSHVEKTIRLVDELQKRGDYEFQFVFFGADAQARRSTTATGRSFLAWSPEEDGVGDFINLLSSFDYLISSRFHGVVFAVILQKPCMIIGIEDKLHQAYLENQATCSYWGGNFSDKDGVAAFDALNGVTFEALSKNREEKFRQGQGLRKELNQFFKLTYGA